MEARPCGRATYLFFSLLILAVTDAQLVGPGSGAARTLLQADGSAELVERYQLTLPSGVSVSDIEFFQKSSNSDCLNVSTNDNILTSRVGSDVNVTATLTFDSLPGITKYKLGVRKRGEQVPLYESSTTFTVVGMALYTRQSDGTPFMVSGDSTIGYKIPYTRSSTPPVDPEDVIHAHIQFPDGTSTDSLPESATRVPLGDSLKGTVEVLEKQFEHNPSLCDLDAIGTYSPTTGVQLPPGCGFGFYRDPATPDAKLLFGFKWNPYRSGSLRIRFDWPGLSAPSVELQEESFETNLNVEVIGSPPIVVSSAPPPSDVFRTEGGQSFNVTLFNADERNLTHLRFQISPGTFATFVPGSLSPIKLPERTQTATFVVQPGTGGPYDAVLQFREVPVSVNTSPTPAPSAGESPGTSVTPAPTTSPGFSVEPLTDAGTSFPSATGSSTPSTSTSVPGTSGSEAPSMPGTETSGTSTTPVAEELFQDAIMQQQFRVSYDDQTLFIESVSPTSGNEEGGLTINLNGYFSNFDTSKDSISFSGLKIPPMNILSSSPDKIQFKLPPRSSLGTAAEYEVTVEVGNGISNRVRFNYLLEPKDVNVSILPIGTSDNGDGSLRVGECTPVQFIVQAEPLTRQIRNYQWVLSPADSPQDDLFKTRSELQDVDVSQSSIMLQPQQIGPIGSYTLYVIVTLDSGTSKQSIVLSRDNKPTTGAFLLPPPKRTVSSPKAPVRVFAVVTPPGECASGPGMRYEWTIFNKTYPVSPTSTSDEPNQGPVDIGPTRLGREFFIPQSKLSPGKHEITFKVWYGDDTKPSGFAKQVVQIVPDKLVPVIRNGESEMEVNWATDLQLFAGKSFDPDAPQDTKREGISYEWTCTMAAGENATEARKCPSNILPLNASSSKKFTVPKEEIRTLGDDSQLKFGLTVKKGSDSQSTSLVINISKGGTRPTLQDYDLSLVNVFGEELVARSVPTYETVILMTKGPVGSTWSYELAKPTTPNFRFFEMLAKGPTLYAPSDNAGSKKSLGFDVNKLDSFTSYDVLIKFPGSSTNAPTSVVFPFKTAETPRLGVLRPVPTEGDTTTVFTATAGLPLDEDIFSYFFHATDSEGNEVCVGGCTGFHIAFFTLFTPGTYTLSATLYNKRGGVLLDKKILPSPLRVKASGKEKDIFKQLESALANGDDALYSQLIHDLALAASDDTPSETAIEMLFGKPYQLLKDSGAINPISSIESSAAASSAPLATNPEQSAPPLTISERTSNEVYGPQRKEARSVVAKGTRKIICSSTANSKSGRAALTNVARLLTNPYLPPTTWNDLLYATICAIDHAIPTDAVGATDLLPAILVSLYKHAAKLDNIGLGRSSLQADPSRPGSLTSDVVGVVGRLMVRTFAVGQVDGYTSKVMLGTNGEFGFVSLFAGSAATQMHTAPVSGGSAPALQGRTQEELFYIDPAHYSAVFSGTSKRYLAFHGVPNFVTGARLNKQPAGGSLDDTLYWTQVFGLEATLSRLRPSSDVPAFCVRMPVVKNRDFFTSSVQLMPGMYSFSQVKGLGVEALRKSQYYKYDLENIKVLDYNVTSTSGWVEGCHIAPKLFGTTAVSRSTEGANGAAQARGLQPAALSGDQSWAVPYLVGACMVALVVVIVVAWLIALRGARPVVDTGGYVERDDTGRAAAVNQPSGVAPVAT